MTLRDIPRADDHDSEVILVGPEAERKRRAATRWGILLVIYMRTLAVLWMCFGVLHWASILHPGPVPFDALPFEVAVAIAVFAVADLVAAVGLWLVAPWGGALWLATAAGELIAGAFLPGALARGPLMVAAYGALIAVYFVLTWLAAQERERP
ncbi:MAG: hypothetical protein K2Y29_16750 [Beijerinckiaceae bacterium]|nr:hypothetical protein [Beijerinckiaceae bacterium]